MMEEKYICVEKKNRNDDEEEGVGPPGFRFHPTDEELLGFYLLRKVQGKSTRLDFITHLDIYKYHPWDLPKMSSCTLGEKEWYFFCKRGRKYRNSLRPNRVTETGSGFWKATGIDKQIVCNNNNNDDNNNNNNNKCIIIGLKKTLVYYRGNARRGTKTDWMMHEFRFPPTHSITNQQAEVWTLCRIFKRDASHKRCTKPEREQIISHKTSLFRVSAEETSGKCTNFKGNLVIKNNLQQVRSYFDHNIYSSRDFNCSISNHIIKLKSLR